jgi:hypothetical protein
MIFGRKRVARSRKPKPPKPEGSWLFRLYMAWFRGDRS